MKSKDLAMLSVVLAVIAVVFWQIGQPKPPSTDSASAPAPSASAPKPAASSASAAGTSSQGSTVSAPTKPAVPASGVVRQTGDKYTTPSGLQVEILQAGSGTEAISGRPVTVNYTGTFANGTVFDSSLNPGRTPLTFQLGGHQVIAGWDEGVEGMKVGEKRKLVIPANLAYGANGKGPIPPNTELTFEVELLGVN